MNFFFFLSDFSQVVSKAVYKGVLELLKFLMQFIEAELTKDLEHPVFSLFLVLRLALCLCMRTPYKKAQSTKSTSTKLESGLKASRKTGLPEEKSTKGSSVLDAGSSSLKAAETENKQTKNDLSEIKEEKALLVGTTSKNELSHGDDYTDGVLSKSPRANGLPEEIEMQQMAGDSPPKRPIPPLVKIPSKKVMISSPAPEKLGEGGVASYIYLHNDLIRELGPGFKGLVVKRQFWNNMFASVVHTDRKYLGWNEKTSELYDRYTYSVCIKLYTCVYFQFSRLFLRMMHVQFTCSQIQSIYPI